MLINVERVNQTESHKWVWHIFKNTYGTYFISKRSWLFLIHSMLPLNRFIIKLLPRSLGTPFVPLKYDLETYGISGNLFDRFLLKNWIQIIKHVPCVFLKIWRTHCALCVIFKNMWDPLMGLGLVDVVDVNKHDFEASDISGTILNPFLSKSWI